MSKPARIAATSVGAVLLGAVLRTLQEHYRWTDNEAFVIGCWGIIVFGIAAFLFIQRPWEDQ